MAADEHERAPVSGVVGPSGRGAGWYHGDCHVHTRRSHGGELTPQQLTAAAREMGLDFLVITEHNAASTPEEWAPFASDDLLIIAGQEVVTETGHWLALGLEPDQVIDRRAGLVDHGAAQVHQVGGLCVVAHPHAPYPSGTFTHPMHGFDAVEVWNGPWSSDLPWQADNETALAQWGHALAQWGHALAIDLHQGRWRPAVGNSDVHLPGQLGTPQTVVHTEDLSAAGILAGIRAGRCWITESAEIGLSVTAHADDQHAGIGQSLGTGGQSVLVDVTVSGVPSGTVTLHTDRGQVHRDVLPDNGTGSLEWSTTAAESAFVRVEVRHPSGYLAALTNPIILAGDRSWENPQRD